MNSKKITADHWVDFLRSRKYDWFFTGTYSYEATEKINRRAMERFALKLRKSYDDVEIFWVAELHKKGDIHVHALIRLTDAWGKHYRTQFDSLRIAWNLVNAGNHRNKIKKINSDYAAKYCTKYLLKNDGLLDYDVYLSIQ